MNATSIVNRMYDNDNFSQWLGIERLDEKPGFIKLKMMVRDEMCNGFNIAHGGISYSLADSALAFAANSHGKHAVSIETSISHLKPVYAGGVLIATAQEKSRSNRIGVYEVKIENENNELVALFKGTVYVKDSVWS